MAQLAIKQYIRQNPDNDFSTMVSQLQSFRYRISATEFQLQSFSYRVSATEFQLQSFSYRVSANGFLVL